MEYPSSDSSEHIDSFLASSEPEISPILDKRRPIEETFLTEPMTITEPARPETDQRQITEKEQKLISQIEALRNAESEQHQRIEEANNASSRRPSLEPWVADIEPKIKEITQEGHAALPPTKAIPIGTAAEPEASTTEQERLNAEIKTLGQKTSEQIDRMDEAKSRLSMLEEIRSHAEKMVFKRAEREMRLQAEIEALHQAEAEQIKRIEQAEVEVQRLTEEQTRQREAAQAGQLAQAGAHQSARAEALQLTEDKSRRVTEEEEQRIAHLETIRARAEEAGKQRAEKEQQLNSELLAFSAAAAEQLNRIQKAENDLAQAEETLHQVEEKARLATEALASRLAETEPRRRAAEDRLAREESTLAELKAIQSRAEAETAERTQLEQRLKSDIEALTNANEQQLKRIEEARAASQRLVAEENRLRRIAEREDQRLVDLEAVRADAEARVKHREKEEQRLATEIEAFQQVEGEQLNRIAEAELHLFVRQEESKAAELGISPEEVYWDNDSGADSSEDTRPPLADTQLDSSDAESTAAWSITQHNNQIRATTSEVELTKRAVSSVADGRETEAAEKAITQANDSTSTMGSEESFQSANEATPIIPTVVARAGTDMAVGRVNTIPESASDKADAFSEITVLFDDSSQKVRSGAARALYNLSPARAETFTRALREASPERRRQIIRALDSSGLAAEAIDRLAGETREKTYEAFSMLFLMAKAGEIQSLLQAIERHSNSAVRLSVIKLLTFSNRPDIIPALRSLAVRGALPIEVRSALMESIYEISSNARERALSAA